ncbi:MAG: N-acetyl-gamma-glutamyl-phosphate reductase [Desulfobacterales bacterium]
MIRVAVMGATGYAGAELVRILTGHPDVDLTVMTSRQYAGRPMADIYPAFKGIVEASLESFDGQRLSARADAVFVALPHKIPMEIVPGLLEQGLKVVDLSADFRFKDAALYERTYQPHSAPAYLGEAAYGLCEVFGAEIAAARLVGNPGCYPTSVLLPLVPLLYAGLIAPGTLIADSKSGVSGAGRSPSLASHVCEVSESFKAYKVTVHRHTPEMASILSQAAGQDVGVTFTPHLLPMNRGMLSTIYAELRHPDIQAEEIQGCLETFYRNKPFVRLCGPDKLPDTRHVRGTNFCDIGFRLDVANGRLILLSAIDNLVKGAAGQAVQNMNLMFGLNETAGLMPVPYPV